MPGIILGALGGAGEAASKLGSDYLNTQWKSDADQSHLRLASDLGQQKSEALAIFTNKLNVQSANDQRTAQVGRIDAAKTGIIANAIADKYGAATPADPSTWTQEQQAAVDQSKALDTRKMEDDPKIAQRAAVKTGDIGPKDAAALDQRSEADLTRLMLGDQRMQTMAQIAAGHDDTRKLVAGMVAASKGAGAAKEDRVIVHQFLQQYDRKIATNESEIKSLRSTLKDAFDDGQRSEIKTQIDELQKANKNLTRAQVQYAKDSGVSVPDMEEPEKSPMVTPPVNRPPLSSFKK